MHPVGGSCACVGGEDWWMSGWSQYWDSLVVAGDAAGYSAEVALTGEEGGCRDAAGIWRRSWRWRRRRWSVEAAKGPCALHPSGTGDVCADGRACSSRRGSGDGEEKEHDGSGDGGSDDDGLYVGGNVEERLAGDVIVGVDDDAPKVHVGLVVHVGHDDGVSALVQGVGCPDDGRQLGTGCTRRARVRGSRGQRGHVR
ncbi:hypothetical protein L1887_60853 [Cichorium endivia]|nr:hypothetical protein L1887_60853 [Cichorium endivia]